MMTKAEVMHHHASQMAFYRTEYLQWVNVREKAKRNNKDMYRHARHKAYIKYVYARDTLRYLEG